MTKFYVTLDIRGTAPVLLVIYAYSEDDALITAQALSGKIPLSITTDEPGT